MAVEKDVTRKCVVITWDTSVVQGDTCTIDAENVETGGLGGAGEQKNDGSFPLAYPQDYVGASFITVTGSDGGVEEGEITIGNYVPVEPGEPGAPPVVDNTLPGVEGPVDPDYGVDEGAHPDHELPGDQPRPDHELPGDQPHPDHELPGDQPVVDPRKK